MPTGRYSVAIGARLEHEIKKIRTENNLFYNAGLYL
jgi:hypothetical protein